MDDEAAYQSDNLGSLGLDQHEAQERPRARCCSIERWPRLVACTLTRPTRPRGELINIFQCLIEPSSCSNDPNVKVCACVLASRSSASSRRDVAGLRSLKSGLKALRRRDAYRESHTNLPRILNIACLSIRFTEECRMFLFT